MESRPEQGLLERARGGEREAFAELVRRHQDRVFGFCLSMLPDRAEAEEAAQDAFIKAFEALRDFRGDSAFSTWILSIASNHCLDRLRRRGRRRESSLDGLSQEDRDRLESWLVQADPEASLEASDLVGRALGQLPEEYRAVLVLREMQGLSYREIALVLGSSLDSVKARLRRARAELERGLRHFLGPGDV